MRKKAYLVIIATMIMSIVSCNQNKLSTQNEDNGVSNTSDSLAADTSGHYMEFITLSNRDLWLRVDPSLPKSDLIKRLEDAYNASVIQNSIMTDFDLQMRGYELNEVIKAIKSIDITRVKDVEILAKLKAYKKEMLCLLSVDPDSIKDRKSVV